MGKSVPDEELYQRMSEGAETKTSQVSVVEYLQYFEKLLQEGKDILHIEFSSGLSGSYNSAHLATEELMVAHAEEGLSYHGKCYICHSVCIEDAKMVAALVEAKFPNLQGKVEIYPIGATIGSHTGPGTLALFFWGDKRTD